MKLDIRKEMIGFLTIGGTPLNKAEEIVDGLLSEMPEESKTAVKEIAGHLMNMMGAKNN